MKVLERKQTSEKCIESDDKTPSFSRGFRSFTIHTSKHYKFNPSEYKFQSSPIKKEELFSNNVKFPFPIISPYGKFRNFWNTIIFIALIYISSIFPIRIAFIELSLMEKCIIVDIFTDVIFLIDIVMNFISAYENSNGKLIHKFKEIQINYLKSWFIIDLIGMTPFFLIFYNRNKNFLFNLISLARLLRLHYFIQVKIQLQNIFIKLKLSKKLLSIGYYICLIINLIHIMGCIWIFIITTEPTDKESLFLLNYNPYEVYASSIYFIILILATIGYGNITPDTISEKILISVFMFIGIAVFGQIMGYLTNTFNKLKRRKTKIKIKNDFYLLMGKEFDIPQQLLCNVLLINNSFQYSNRNRIRGLEFFCNAREKLFKDLPNDLIYDLCIFFYNDLFKKINFFQSKPKLFIIKILTSLHPLIIKKGEMLYKEGDLSSEVYFIQTGRIISKCRDDKNRMKSHIFPEGSFFGDIDIILKRERFETAYGESERVLIWKIDRIKFLSIIEEYSDILKEIQTQAVIKYDSRKNVNSASKVRKILLPANYYISKLRKIRKQSVAKRRAGKLKTEKFLLNQRKSRVSLSNGRNMFNIEFYNEGNNMYELSEEEIEDIAKKQLYSFLSKELKVYLDYEEYEKTIEHLIYEENNNKFNEEIKILKSLALSLEEQCLTYNNDNDETNNENTEEIN